MAESTLSKHITLSAVRRVVITLMMHEKPTIDRVARKLQLSERTLHRRLKEAGTTYSELLDQCRLRQAKQLLGATDAKLYEIAEATGYKDPSSFSRAFFRWTGDTPRRFRKQQRASAGGREQSTEAPRHSSYAHKLASENHTPQSSGPGHAVGSKRSRPEST